MSLKTFNLTYTETNSAKGSNSTTKTGVIVVAAGSASRMAGQNKILSNLSGIPVIIRTLKAFEEIEAVKSIVVVTREDMVLDIQNLIQQYNLNKTSDITVGGASRQESVKNGFDVLSKDSEIQNILIHDGARPLVSRRVIEEVIAATEEFKAAVPAVPVKDTIKKVGALDKIVETPDRSKLKSIQTPQGFAKVVYEVALEKVKDKLSEFTDDSGLVESTGVTVYATKGDYKNIKITTPEDLCIAKALLDFEGENLL